MNDNQFDEFFRNKLEKFASDVPGDMWHRINKKDKDRKFFFFRWYMLAALLLFTGMVTFYFLYEKNDSSNVYTKNVATDHANKNRQPGKNESFKKNTAEENNIAESLENANKVNASAKNIHRNITNKKVKKVLHDLDKTSEIISQQNFDINTIQGKEIVTSNTNNEASAKAKDKATNKKNSIEKDSAQLIKDLSDNNSTEDESINDKFTLELYASPDIPFNNISSYNSRYEQSLKDASHMHLSYSIGARLGVKINDHWHAKIGVQYSQINLKMNFTDSILTETDVSNNNKFRSADVPFVLSYTKRWSNNFSSSVNAGILLNITSKYKGVIPDPSGETVHIDNSTIYKSNTGVNIYLGIDLAKQLNNKTDLFAEPFFRYRIKSITTSMPSFNQKVHAAGISIGLRYRLFKIKEEE